DVTGAEVRVDTLQRGNGLRQGVGDARHAPSPGHGDDAESEPGEESGQRQPPRQHPTVVAVTTGATPRGKQGAYFRVERTGLRGLVPPPSAPRRCRAARIS